MAKNDFKPFATGNGANVLTQAEDEGLAALASGFTSGKASSAQINKAIRQATAITSVIAQFTADNGGSDVLDNGNTAAILASFITALNTSVGNSLGSNFLRKTNNLSDISNATTSRQNLSAAKSGANSDITALNGLTTPLTVPQGGTGATSAINARANLYAAQLGANSDITSLSGLTTALSIPQGGTGATSAAQARDNLYAAGRNANSDITSLSGLTTALSVTQGGTGAKTATAARANLFAGGIPTALNSAQGWWKCADTGRIFQHGKVAITSGSQLTFPIAFPNACFAVILTDNDGYKGVGLLGATTTYASFTSGSGGTVTVGYLAIGY
nr:MAG TPA: tail protein [Caudoviricetes sp.]